MALAHDFCVGSQNSKISGLKLSRVVFGAWRITEGRHQGDPVKLAGLLEVALAHGITSVDHADIYGGYAAEAFFGEALRHVKHVRHQLQLISKCGIKLVAPARPDHRFKHYDTSAHHIVSSVERSLTNLRTDYLDLLLIHRPDPLMDADEIAEAFAALHRQGKVLHFGVSNFTAQQYELLASRLALPLVANQIEFGPMATSALTDGTLDQCQKLRVIPMAWSPLAGGRLLTGTGEVEKRLRQEMQAVGAELGGADVAQVALAWIMRHPAQVVPILGSSDATRLISQAAAVQLPMSREQWHRLWSAAMGKPVP